MDDYFSYNGAYLGQISECAMTRTIFYFSYNGAYLGSDNSSTRKAKVIDAGQWMSLSNDGISIDKDLGAEISTLHSESNISTNSSLNIYQHYNQTDLKVVDKAGPQGKIQALFEYDEKSKTAVDIALDVNAFKKWKICDNIPEIQSYFIHESQHYSNFKTMGYDLYSNTLESSRERLAVTAQMKDPSWQLMRPGVQNGFSKYGNIIKLERLINIISILP